MGEEKWINKIHEGDVLDVLKKMPDNFVDMSITSPPYYGLRDYGVNNQIGLEEHPQIYIDKLVEIFHELKRVLKPTGSFFLNCGDTFFGGNLCYGMAEDYKSLSTINKEKYNSKRFNDFIKNRNKLRSNWLQPKQLLMVPYRLAAKMQDDGWILRNIIIWSKQNPMPSSVKDRFNTSYEPIFFFAKNQKYFFDLDSIREPYKTSSIKRYDHPLGHIRTNAAGLKEVTGYHCDKDVDLHPLGKIPNDFFDYDESKFSSKEEESKHRQGFSKDRNEFDQHPLGKTPTDIFPVNTESFKGAHFACVDEETEVLTEEGWKTHKKLTENDKIATFDIFNEKIYYHKPYNIYKYNYEGDLCVIENQWISQHITPNHRVLLKYIRSKTRKHLRHIEKNWRYENAEDLRPYRGFFVPNAGHYKGKYSIGKEKAELIGWIITEGMIKKNGSIDIYQSLSANPEKVKRIEYLLNTTNQKYIKHKRERPYKNKKSIEITFSLNKTKNDNSWIFEWINNNKKPKWKLLHLINEELEMLFKGFIDGDGHRRKNDKNRVYFIQNDRYIQLFFRTLCVHLNKRTTLYKRTRAAIGHQSHITNKNCTQVHPTKFKSVVTNKKYKGIIWCPHLPNGNFVAKRNNKIFITGNTFPKNLIKRPILASCPQQVCKKCGVPRKRIIKNPDFDCSIDTENIKDVHKRNINNEKMQSTAALHRTGNEGVFYMGKTVGWTKCKCNAGFETGIVLDPFLGSGTTAVVAKELNRRWIGIELNPEYIEMAKNRIKKYVVVHNFVGKTDQSDEELIDQNEFYQITKKRLPKFNTIHKWI